MRTPCLRGALVLLALAAAASPSASSEAGSVGVDGVEAAWTGRHSELRKTVPIADRKLQEPRTVFSLELPRLHRGDILRFTAEVTATTTCVERLPRCIGRAYRFDPRVGAQLVLAPDRRARRGRAMPVSGRESLECEQTRPNRNHHCPLVVAGRLEVPDRRRLPCRPARCRLNLLLDSHDPRARGGEVIVVGADRPDGSVEGGKGRLSAVTLRGGGHGAVRRVSGRRRAGRLPVSGSQRVVLSQRLPPLRDGDVVVAVARQRTGIRELPYFVAAKLVLAARPGATAPRANVRRIGSRAATFTDTNGFNCTPGPSAFRSPCRTEKAGLVEIKRSPRRPLFANLVMRSFPKRVQARASFPPARVEAGRLVVTRVRAAPPFRSAPARTRPAAG